MAFFYRPRLAGALLGFPQRAPLHDDGAGRWRSASLRAGPEVLESASGETVAVTLLLPVGSGLSFAESGKAWVEALFPPPPASGAFTGPALVDATLVSDGPPRFSHVLITVRAHYVGHTDVFLRHRILILR